LPHLRLKKRRERERDFGDEKLECGVQGRLWRKSGRFQNRKAVGKAVI
jgi:hypothetical protein